MILLYSLPSPINSQATIIPLIVAYLSPLPFCFILIYQLIRGKCCPKKKQSIRRTSIDTLSKTTRQASEAELESMNELPSTKKSPLPLDGLDIISDSEPVKIKVNSNL